MYRRPSASKRKRYDTGSVQHRQQLNCAGVSVLSKPVVLMPQVQEQQRLVRTSFEAPHRGRLLTDLRQSSLKPKQSPEKPDRLSRRHGWHSISRRITSTDDNLRFRHAYRLDELIESCCV